MTSVGLCEDDDALRGIVRTALERESITVRPTASGAEAVRAFSADAPDVLVLDIGLPDADGRDVCQALRARGVAAPVLFLTARDALVDKLSGFHAGGDDYLTKPFALAELVVRIQALARRATEHAQPDAEQAVGAMLDPTLHAISAGGDTADGDDSHVSLTPTEYRLLAALAASPTAVVRRAALIAAAWPDGARVSANTLDAYISRLRAKLRSAGRDEQITNVRGVGYTLK
jgi:two-component system response regulator MprA